MRLTRTAKKCLLIILTLMQITCYLAAYPAHSRAEEDFPADLFTLDSEDELDMDDNLWNEGISASYYGSIKGKKYFGCIDNKLDPREEYFVALPARKDSLDCLDGRLEIKLDDNTAAFRVIEIKLHGEDGPIFEGTVEDVGPWYCGDDPYWEDYTRPASEDGIDAKGRSTNRAGIDLSFALAVDMGIDGIGKIDWRFKMVDGEYVYVEKETVFR
jgi:hypothetical protein